MAQFLAANIPALRELVKSLQAPCFACDRLVRKGGQGCYEMEAFDSPFDKVGTTVYMHRSAPDLGDFGNYFVESCLDLMEDQSWADFRYFTCDHCYRWVCRQNPAQGYHVQYRWLEDGGDEVCLRCYEEHILENGVDREAIENGQLPGMFFSSGNPEPLEAGYHQILDHASDIDFVRDTVLAAMDNGNQVVIGYERLGLGGGGEVSVFVKEVN